MKHVLIVQSDRSLADVWKRHIERLGFAVHVSASSRAAIDYIRDAAVDLIVLDLDLPDGDPMGVADYAAYRRPLAKVVCVTRSRFFSDGSLFSFSQNACAVLPATAEPADLAVLVDYHGRGEERAPVARATI